MVIKKKLMDHCHQYVNSRIDHAQKAIIELQSSANEETKSSAGDKYETGRAMIQIEIQNLKMQLSESLKLKQILNQIDITDKINRIGPGSIVKTDSANYFLAISAGTFSIENEKYYTMALDAPVAMLLKGLVKGDIFIFNKRNITIKEVCC